MAKNKNNIETSNVVKSNHIVESHYHLTLREQRLILYMISTIKSNDVDFKPYRIAVSDFAAMMDIIDDGAYKAVKGITKGLIEKVLEIKTPTGLLQISWLSSAHYYEGKGYVELRFDPGLKPYLLHLQERFTSYDLENVVRLNSIYSIRIYELLLQYWRIGERTFKITELRKILGIKDSEYDRYNDFKKRVILTAQKELAKSTDISFDFIETKTGRKVTGIVLTIKKDTEPTDTALPEMSYTPSTDPINVTPTPQQPLKPSKKSKSAPTQIVDVIPITPTLRVETTIQPEPIGAKSSKPRQESIAKPINTAASNSSTVGTTAKPQQDPADIAALLDLLPPEHKGKKTITDAITKAYKDRGKDYVIYNIRYSNANCKDKSKYRAYLNKALKENWGEGLAEDIESNKKREAVKKQEINRNKSEIINEKELHQRAVDYIAKLTVHERKKLEDEAFKKLHIEQQNKIKTGDLFALKDLSNTMEDIVMELLAAQDG
ncbi:Initiator Rep protein domain protein [Candidatus Magnetobacterium bavaricum]|uniref:Initiator Rep protein domain protein n=1 Tax=Candidatus Magnetobacterium bavaricum TaxID=29290 RepID=A0A0F3GZR0_9BACT|nr:Initiator Rep protein domain protein [Candidatus Magnetobacterium bavaricum]